MFLDTLLLFPNFLFCEKLQACREKTNKISTHLPFTESRQLILVFSLSFPTRCPYLDTELCVDVGLLSVTVETQGERVVFHFILFDELFKVSMKAPAENKAMLHNVVITNFKKAHSVALSNNRSIFRSPLVHMSSQCP